MPRWAPDLGTVSAPKTAQPAVVARRRSRRRRTAPTVPLGALAALPFALEGPYALGFSRRGNSGDHPGPFTHSAVSVTVGTLYENARRWASKP